jgi:hypothetical protein
VVAVVGTDEVVVVVVLPHAARNILEATSSRTAETMKLKGVLRGPVVHLLIARSP